MGQSYSPLGVVGTVKVCNSYAEFKPSELKPLGRLVFAVLKTLKPDGRWQLFVVRMPLVRAFWQPQPQIRTP